MPRLATQSTILLSVKAFEIEMLANRLCRAGWLGLLIGSVAAWPTVGRAETRVAATATDLRLAAERFDEGRNAFKAGAFSEAAEHFEAADARAPSASALGLAMRSRAEAGQAARAATLAELVLRRYPDDGELVERANAIIAASKSEFGRVTVECAPACDLVVDDKLIHGRAAEQWTLYVEAGAHVVAANWSHDRVVTETIDAIAGETKPLHFQPAAPAPASSAPPRHDVVKEVESTPNPAAKPGSGLPPVVFWIGVGTTVALGGAAIWSGVDTLNSPGPDAVRQGCVGLGESCKLYREGQSNELRTNVLIGATAVVAVASAITGVFFTDFANSGKEARIGKNGVQVRPWIGTLTTERAPASAAHFHPTMLGAEGRF